jgi:hypothetical protein
MFSKENVEFNSSNGLWMVPRDKVPTFQLHIPKTTPNPWAVKEVAYIESKGNFEFTGYIVTIPNPSVNMVRGIKKDDGTTIEQVYVFQSDDNYTIPEPPRCGRWILRLWVEEGGVNVLYYSEEFLTIDV